MQDLTPRFLFDSAGWKAAQRFPPVDIQATLLQG